MLSQDSPSPEHTSYISISDSGFTDLDDSDSESQVVDLMDFVNVDLMDVDGPETTTPPEPRLPSPKLSPIGDPFRLSISENGLQEFESNLGSTPDDPNRHVAPESRSIGLSAVEYMDLDDETPQPSGRPCLYPRSVKSCVTD